jgi:esterase/lipase superfamily enzyme
MMTNPARTDANALEPWLYLPLLLGVALVTGCTSMGRPLMPTPAVYQQDPGASAIFSETPPERQTTAVELLYLTDRGLETDAESELPYGEARSRALALGTAQVEMVPALTWPELEHQSRLKDRTRKVDLALGPVEEIGRFPKESYGIEVTPAGLARSPAALAEHRDASASFEALLQDRLAVSPRKEVVLFVHGFNETFATAAYTLAELCHFLGREHVCMLFTWPASASGGLLTSYTETTESATYAVGHLRKVIRMIGRSPGVEKVHLLAHSRGAALLLNAMRELWIETIAAGIAPAEVLKTGHLVLMAPDIDEDVAAEQLVFFVSDPDMFTRWPGDLVPEVLGGRLTVYSSPEDRALLFSRILFRSRARLGQFDPEKLSPESMAVFAKWGRLDFIAYKGKRTDPFGHSYFHSNPEVSSDLIQLIRNDTRPGEPGRQLEQTGPVGWTFPETETAAASD